MIISVDSLHIFTQMHKIHILFLIDLFFKNYERIWIEWDILPLINKLIRLLGRQTTAICLCMSAMM